jgi:hypothetical protein
MPLSDKKTEITRLIKAFENEADNYHEIEFSLFHVTQKGFEVDTKFKQPNYAIMLWQHYGELGSESAKKAFDENVAASNMQFAVRGAQLTQFALIEGQAMLQFVKMAKRAGSLFSPEETTAFKFRVIKEIQAGELEKDPKGKLVAFVNQNPLAIWLSYLLYYLSKTYPDRENSHKIEPDLFTLSLLALEQLATEVSKEKITISVKDVTKIKFKVAVSFPGEKRPYVSEVVQMLHANLGANEVFYDYDYQSQIARPNADVLLQDIYHKQTDLIVVFICEEYAKKQWPGLEWRAIRDLIKLKLDNRIMIVRFDDVEIAGIFSTDGYIDANTFTTRDVARFILERLELIK